VSCKEKRGSGGSKGAHSHRPEKKVADLARNVQKKRDGTGKSRLSQAGTSKKLSVPAFLRGKRRGLIRT